MAFDWARLPKGILGNGVKGAVMKKGCVYLAIALVVVGGYYIRGALDKRSAAASVQATPEKAVESFMATMAKLARLIYEESQLESLEDDVKELEAKGDEATKDELLDICQRYGLESQAPLFTKEKTCKRIMGAFLIVRFEEFEVTRTKIKGDGATVSATLIPVDIFGFKALAEKLGAPKPEKKPEPLPMTFVLERHRYRWYITDMKGTLGDFSKAFGR